MSVEVRTHQQLEAHFLDTLKIHGVNEGLNYSTLVKKCGVNWGKALAKAKGLKRRQALATDLKNFVYDLWLRGEVFVEPPQGRLTAPRIWDREAGETKFRATAFSAGQSSPSEAKRSGSQEMDVLKSVYDRLAAEHLGGYVPIFKVRRALDWPRDRFDRTLLDLHEREEPILDLLGADPQHYGPNEKRDSLTRRERTYFLIRWRRR